MSTYTTNTSDKKKRKAMKWWLFGLIGLLGFEYFYVGKIKNGLIRLIVGVLCFVGFITIFTEAPSATPVTIIIWLALAIPNLIRLALGSFRDNVGNALRE